VPLGDTLEPKGGLLGVFRRHRIQQSGEVFEGGVAFFELRDQAVMDKTINEGFEFKAGGVVGEAFAVVPRDGPEVFKRPEPDADRAHADPGAPRNVLHRQGLRGAEEQPVDLAVRSGVTKKVRELREDGDHPGLKVQAGLAISMGFGIFLGGGHHGLFSIKKDMVTHLESISIQIEGIFRED